MPIFTSPPGWPTPPPGWTPPHGWQPDPTWPPAPADHVWWTEDAPTSPASSQPSGARVPALEPLEPLEPGPRGSERVLQAQLVMAGGGPAYAPPAAGPVLAGGPGGRPAALAALHDLVPAQPSAPQVEQMARPVAHPQPVAFAAPATPTSRFGTPGPAAGPAASPPLYLDLVRHYTAEQRRAGLRGIGVGVLLALVGIGVTVGGYVTTDVGGSYLVLWGPVAVGLVSVVRGAVQAARAEQAALRQVIAPAR